MHFVTKDLSWQFFYTILIVSTRWNAEDYLILDPNIFNQPPCSCRFSRELSVVLPSKALDSNTHEESWLQARPHGAWALFVLFPCGHAPAQSSWFWVQAKRRDFASSTPRLLVSQPPQACFFSPGSSSCFYLNKMHQFRTQIHKPCEASHCCLVRLWFFFFLI